MAGAGPPPNPNARRTNNRNEGFTTLSGRRKGRLPELPKGDWSATTRAAWKRWWGSPQATQWTDDDYPQVVAMARAYETTICGDPKDAAKAAGEFRQWTDRFGLHPLARLRNRWIVDPAAEEAAAGVEASIADVVDLSSRRSG